MGIVAVGVGVGAVALAQSVVAVIAVEEVLTVGWIVSKVDAAVVVVVAAAVGVESAVG
jgi:hypothetical protein